MVSDRDRIEKQALLRASLARVWRALADAEELGSWFGMKLDSGFAAGATVHGVVVPTAVDAEVARMQEPFRGVPVTLEIEAIEPQRRFAFRWHPSAVDRATDYSSEPTTLVEFVLAEVEGGVLLTVTESGFDRLPPERRDAAFGSNEQGWSLVVGLIAKHVAGKA